MIEITNIKEMIESLSLILQYYVPGFIGLEAYKFCRSTQIKDRMTHTLSCVVSSFVSVKFIELLHSACPNCFLFSGQYWRVIPATVFLLLGSIVFALIVRSDWFNRITMKLFGKTLESDVKTSVLDSKGTKAVYLYFKSDPNTVVYGTYGGRDENSDNEQWIEVYDPRIIRNGDTEDSATYDGEASGLYRIEDIDRIVVVHIPPADKKE